MRKRKEMQVNGVTLSSDDVTAEFLGIWPNTDDHYRYRLEGYGECEGVVLLPYCGESPDALVDNVIRKFRDKFCDGIAVVSDAIASGSDAGAARAGGQ